MKTFLARWYDAENGKEYTKSILAADLPDAKHKAFRMMCDCSADVLVDDLEIYERRYVFECKGETNPRPGATDSVCAQRDYFTGMKMRRDGRNA